jgi:hypothetical protein
VINSWLGPGRQLQAVRLVVAGEVRMPVHPATLDEPELDAPPCRRLVQVADGQPDVVDAPEPDQRASPARRRQGGSCK